VFEEGKGSAGGVGGAPRSLAARSEALRLRRPGGFLEQLLVSWPPTEVAKELIGPPESKTKLPLAADKGEASGGKTFRRSN